MQNNIGCSNIKKRSFLSEINLSYLGKDFKPEGISIEHLTMLIFRRYSKFLEIGLESIRTQFTDEEFLIIANTYPCPGIVEIDEYTLEKMIAMSLGRPPRHDEAKLRIIEKIRTLNIIDKVTLVSCVEQFFRGASPSDLVFLLDFGSEEYYENMRLRNLYR